MAAAILPPAEQAPQAGGTPLLDKIPESASRGIKIADVAARFLLQDLARKLRPEGQIRKCLRWRIPGRELVEVWRNPEAGRAYYQSLITCGRVWHCPVCANRVMEKKRAELVELLGQGETQHIPGQGAIVIPLYHMAMVTFTIQHKRHETAAAVLARLQDAYHRMWSGRWAVGFKQHYHVIGLLRSIDYTYGEHGHHFHIHTLIVCDSLITPEREVEMSETGWRRWSESVEKAGGVASRDAWDFQAGDASAAEYVAKLGIKPGEAGKSWGQIAELTRHPAKQGEGRNLWELLASSGGGDKQAGRVWLEATDALRGVSWLMASPGLYKRLGSTIAAKSDDDVAREQIGEDDRLFAGLSAEAWQVVKTLAKRGELLQQAGPGDVAAFRRWLDSLIVRRTVIDGTEWREQVETVSAGQFVPDWALEGLEGSTAVTPDDCRLPSPIAGAGDADPGGVVSDGEIF